MDSRLPVSTLRRIDAACDQFEAAWRGGDQPRIEDFLMLCELEERPQLLDSLQKLQQELILKQMPAGARVIPTSPPLMLAGHYRSASTPISSNASDSASETQQLDPPRVMLRVVAGPHEGQEFIYDQYDTLLVGRSSQAQLRLQHDRHFSRHHFRLEANPPSCYLMDLGSRNGTFVNGERTTEHFLKDGDVISGGRTRIVVSIRESQQSKAGSIRSASSSESSTHENYVEANTRHDTAGGESPHINGYEIHDLIGRGDLGAVFRATRLATGEVCALKVISPAAHADDKSIQTFLREASILKQLQHQYIVRLIEMGASGSNLFLSTEYLPAVPWQKLSGHLPTSERIRIACAIMCQILGALEHAHERAMVHRDVKPGNILLSRLDGQLVAKLADFGLAKHYTTAGMSQMTREGDVIGSLPFMSPEQFINSREARPGCDLYSAGATLYWMITGEPPIQLENHPCKFLAILEDAPVPIRQHCPEVPSELAELIHQSLDKSPENRFASAAKMRQHIRNFTQ